MTPDTWRRTLREAAATAALAPSSHNCQPWRVLCLDAGPGADDLGAAVAPPARWDRALVVGIDRRRALSALPTLEREMRLSVGGFAALLHHLLRLAGLGVEWRWLPPDWRPARGRARLEAAEPVGVCFVHEPADGARPVDHPLREWIAWRRTERGPFLREGAPAPEGRCLPPAFGGDDDGLHWHHVPPGPRLDQLARFYRLHAAEDFRHGAAWRETYRHLDFAAPGGHDDGAGLAIESLLGPLPAWRRRLAQVLLHPAALRLTGPLGLNGRMGRELAARVRDSAGLVYLRGPAGGDERRTQLRAGERVIDFWLGATRDGLALHPLSVVLQHRAIQARLRALLECADPVLFIARIGRPAPSPASGPRPPRRLRPADAFCLFDTDPTLDLPPC